MALHRPIGRIYTKKQRGLLRTELLEEVKTSIWYKEQSYHVTDISSLKFHLVNSNLTTSPRFMVQVIYKLQKQKILTYQQALLCRLSNSGLEDPKVLDSNIRMMRIASSENIPHPQPPKKIRIFPDIDLLRVRSDPWGFVQNSVQQHSGPVHPYGIWEPEYIRTRIPKRPLFQQTAEVKDEEEADTETDMQFTDFKLKTTSLKEEGEVTQLHEGNSGSYMAEKTFRKQEPWTLDEDVWPTLDAHRKLEPAVAGTPLPVQPVSKHASQQSGKRHKRWLHL
ncbi:hypothetical protein G7Y89_g6782 [Cudoniella acicularis]|uniref:Uncharacterized protein n=1 Tax=Cudoniella acicularis TaxID=354080 RepID=A0A8H4RJS8_9HELO|nr:hypothetical protein G7Y89_g6782 [Cudoniella acicularis]